LLSLPIV
jgi:DNA-directed RNA polymerase III subunit RPC1